MEPGAIVGFFGEAEPLRRAKQALTALGHRLAGQHSVVLSDGERLLRPEDEAAHGARSAVGQLQAPDGAEMPWCGETRDGAVALALEGSLIEHEFLRVELQDRGALLHSNRDAELILHGLALSTQGTFINRMVDALRTLRGGWALLALSPERLVAVRDPWGLRTLWMGRLGAAVAFATESCALRAVSARSVRELHPGEMVIVDASGVSAITPFPRGVYHPCLRDAVAGARDDSDLGGHSLYRLRQSLGERLAALAATEADAVVPLPPTGLVASQGYARVCGLPLAHALLPTEGERPFSAIRAACEGQRLILLSPTLSTGRRLRAAVRALRDAGAARVHVRILTPSTVGPCLYGVELRDPEALLAASSEASNLASSLGADSAVSLGVDALRDALGVPTACGACFTGTYPLLPELRAGLKQLPLFSGETDGAL